MIQRAFHLYQFQQPLKRKHALGEKLHVPRDLGLYIDKVPADVNLKFAKKAMEAEFLKKTLDRNKGVVSRAARDLGISRVNLYELVNRYSIRIQEYKVRRSTEKQKMRTEGVQ
jgi:DNA-binding NtrC family response regulator